MWFSAKPSLVQLLMATTLAGLASLAAVVGVTGQTSLRGRLRQGSHQRQGALATTTVTEAKTLVLKHLRIFSDFVVNISACLKRQMLVNFPGTELSGTKHKFRRRKKRVICCCDHVFTSSKKIKLPITFGSSCRKWRLTCYISPKIYGVIFSFPFWAPVTSCELSRRRCF